MLRRRCRGGIRAQPPTRCGKPTPGDGRLADAAGPRRRDAGRMTEPVPHPDRAYDVAVVGGGPGGHAAALEAARLGARVALLERRRPDSLLGRPALPSKTLRAAVLDALAAPHRGRLDLA